MSIYYGADTQVIGPYHPDEFMARQAAKELMRGPGGRQVYQITANSYEDARRKLLRVTRP